MTFKGFNEKLSWIDSFVDVRMRLIDLASDKLPLNQTTFKEINDILDDYQRYSMSMENSVMKKLVKSVKLLVNVKMEHRTVKEMYQKSMSGSGPFKLDEVIKKCQNVAIELKSLYSF